jgi:hypothetical protein
MIMKNISKLLPVFLFALVIMSSCEKEYLSNEMVVITTPVSFATDINPILTADCATPNCHVNGGIAPNLVADKAYDELTGLGYVDTTNATESILYKVITSTTNPMPPVGNEPLSAEEIGYILAWIEQGAQNN